MTKTSAVLFDFGGTLFSYEGVVSVRHERAKLMAEMFGFSHDTERVGDALRKGMRRSAQEHFPQPFYLHRDMMERGMQYAADELGSALSPQHADEFVSLMHLGFIERITPRPGMHETLAALRALGLHIGAVSNSDRDQFEGMVNVLEVRDSFDSLLCSEEARSCKPDAGIFQEALQRAGCRPDEALFVGDSPDHDIAGAERVGMRALLIRERSEIRPDSSEPSDGVTIIDELSEVLEHV